MKLRKSQTVLFALGIFLWAHFIPSIISPPWSNPERYYLEGKFSFSTKYLGTDLGPEMTLGETEEMLINARVWKWIILSILFVMGIYSCWLIWLDSKYWPYLVFTLSGLVSAYTIPPIINLFNFSPTWAEHFAYVVGYIPRHASSPEELLDAYLSIMYIYLSPILFGVMFLYTTYEIASRLKNRQIAA